MRTYKILAGLVLTCLHSAPAMEKLGQNFWNIGWGRTTQDYFRDDTDFATTTNPWKPEFLADLGPFGVFRFMDWCRANDIHHSSWSQRTSKSSPNQNPVAYEWMIDLANRAKSDMWINLPPKADKDYSFQLAQLIKENLDPTLKVYVEWGNETWNTMMLGSQVSDQMGSQLNLPPASDSWDKKKSWSYHVYASVRVFEQFDKVFGQGSPRVVKVLAGQAGYNTQEGGNPVMALWHLQMLEDPAVNPQGIRADAYAIAPYMNGGSLEDLRSDIHHTTRMARMHRLVTQGKGMKLLGYEGGQHVTSNADKVNRDAGIYEVYRAYLDSMHAAFDGVFVHYTLYSTWSGGGAWGAKEYAGQPEIQSHKYRALADFATSNLGSGTSAPRLQTFPEHAVERPIGRIRRNYDASGREAAKPISGISLWE